MVAAALHKNENERLHALYRLQILDTLPEVNFDNITKLAASICEAPVSLITFVDKNRTWIKSKFGSDVTETSRDDSICSHTILNNEIFEISDATQDIRFEANPFVANVPNVRFYAGIAFHSPDKYPVGTLCLVDFRPRVLTKSQRITLNLLAQQLNQIIELRIKIMELEEFRKHDLIHRTAFNQMSEGVVLQNTTGAIVSFNPASLSVLELSEDELLGKSLTDPSWKCFKEDGSPFPSEEHPAIQVLKNGLPLRDVLMGVKSNLSPLKWLNIQSDPIFSENDEKPCFAVTIFADITEKHEHQILMIQDAKMRALGEMAGNLAHEINTPLAIITVIAETLIQDLEENELKKPEVDKLLRKIDSTAMKIAAIVRGLKAFARESDGDPKQAVLISTVLNDCMVFCQQKFATLGIRLDIEILDDGIIKCVPVQISQVILNLLNNAADVVLARPEKWVKVIVKNNDGKIKLSVVDCGTGIPQEIVQKLMTPFFTTKGVGKGTGLGLSISARIVESCGGKLSYELYEGHTSFTFELDIVNPEVSKNEAA